MSMNVYSRAATSVAGALRRVGALYTLTLLSPENPGYDAATSATTPAAPVSVAARGAIFPLGDARFTTARAQGLGIGARQLLLAVDNFPRVPTKGDFVDGPNEVGATTRWTVAGCDALGPAGTPVLFDCLIDGA